MGKRIKFFKCDYRTNIVKTPKEKKKALLVFTQNRKIEIASL